MPEHMKMRHTKKVEREKRREDDSISAEEFIKKHYGDLPEWAIYLRGIRAREGITQVELGNALGIPQTNISKMELGKRPIGKALAKKLAEFFKADYRLFL